MPNNMPTLNQDITIVGMGEVNKHGEKPSTLQYASVKQLTGKRCFKNRYPKKKIPNSFSNDE